MDLQGGYTPRMTRLCPSSSSTGSASSVMTRTFCRAWSRVQLVPKRWAAACTRPAIWRASSSESPRGTNRGGFKLPARSDAERADSALAACRGTNQCNEAHAASWGGEGALEAHLVLCFITHLQTQMLLDHLLV